MSVHPLWTLLEFNAREAPDSPAVITQRETWTNSEFLETVRGLAGELRTEGIRKGDIVLSMCSPSFEWFMLCALAFEGAISVSTHVVDHAEVVGATHIVTDRDDIPDSVAGLTVIRIDEKFRDRAAALQPGYQPVDTVSPDDIIRLTLTSGTTGRPKAVTMLAGSLAARAEVLKRILTPERNINLLGFSSGGGFVMAFGNVVMGIPCYFANAVNADLPSFLSAHKISVVTASPIAAAKLVNEIHASPADVSINLIRMSGSEPAPTLLNRISSELGAEVESAYGSTEGGVISVKRFVPGTAVNNVGKTVPGAHVLIVDADGNELPKGEVGEVRVKGASMAPGYFRDPEATARHFVDGWFIPGDRGYVTTDGELFIVGRDNAVLNIGGVKIDAALMERTALTVSGVTEAGITTAADAMGIPRLVCVLTVSDPEAPRKVDALLRREFPNGFPNVYISADALPRNSMGKLLRDELRESISGDVAGIS